MPKQRRLNFLKFFCNRKFLAVYTYIERALIKQCGVKADALYRAVLVGVEPRTGSSWVEMWVGRR